MQLIVITIGHKLPRWVNDGITDFMVRFPTHMPLKLIEIPVQTNKEAEGILIEKALPKQAHVVALCVTGSAWSSEELSVQLDRWQHLGKDIVFMIGGPEGFSPSILERSHQKWSLSPLTLPHALARLLVIEQLYRAHTILSKHPYHRA